ncbi:DUF3141 domain-containing protein [Ornithinimicrobium avium]|uniref:DUF3141 domain-containing protein n=1 Tax=Ornithinimicrobium avium TaxID=2283195 RepID=A0A345NL96_9MICO|nr:DUF3141 domain-containing protein [Ornithinimicrobium avium]AXH95804.1 DUF3141 domain-containing protein [Ornithinimicrobium avium]
MTDAATAPAPVSDRRTDVPFEPGVGAHLEHSAEPQDVRWTFAPFDVAAAWTKGWVDWTTNAVRRGSTPLGVLADAQRFWSVATERKQPAWSTPFRVVREWPVARLLDFSTEPGSDVVPTVFLPPQAGHASTIVDHAPGQSQVVTALEEGLTRLFVVDWLGATTATKDTTVEDYVKVLDETLAQLGGRANLVGDCQGGWLATIYAALRPGSVASLTIGAAPIDFHAGAGAIQDWVDSMGSEEDPMLGYRLLVEANGGVHRGELQVNGFKMMEPAGELTRLADLWANVGDPEHVERYRRFVSWFETPQDMPGAFYLWTVEHLFLNNELVAGTLQVGDETVDLGRITMPVNLLAGTGDHITPPGQVWALAEHVSTPPEDVSSHFVEAGHLGLFMGRRALKEHWAPLFRSVREKTAVAPAQSKPAPKPASAPKTSAAKKAPAKKAPAKKAPVQTAPTAKTEPASTPVAKPSTARKDSPKKA